MITLYGIPNCDSVKKARQWFANNAIDIEFHDFRKHPIDRETIQNWADSVEINNLLNRKSTSWRKLDESTRASCDNIESAITVMSENVTLIKRPVVVTENDVIVGVQLDTYSQLFKPSS